MIRAAQRRTSSVSAAGSTPFRTTTPQKREIVIARRVDASQLTHDGRPGAEGGHRITVTSRVTSREPRIARARRLQRAPPLGARPTRFRVPAVGRRPVHLHPQELRVAAEVDETSGEHAVARAPAVRRFVGLPVAYEGRLQGLGHRGLLLADAALLLREAGRTAGHVAYEASAIHITLFKGSSRLDGLLGGWPHSRRHWRYCW